MNGPIKELNLQAARGAEPPAWWRFAQLLTEDLEFQEMSERATREFAGITRSDALLGAVVAAQVGRFDKKVDDMEIAHLRRQLEGRGGGL
jgi:hypothetical protein